MNGDNAAALVTVRPIGKRVDPLLNMVWLKLVDRQIRDRRGKPLAPLEVPLIGPFRAMFLRPFKNASIIAATDLDGTARFFGCAMSV